MTFYNISFDDKYKEVEYHESTDWEEIKCEKDEGHHRAGNRIGQLKVNVVGKTISDFYWTFLSECIISENVLNTFKENKITGFEVKAVKVCNTKINTKLWEFIVIGKGGEAKKESGIYLKDECKKCNLKTYSAYEQGIVVNENNWDGSDVFTVIGYPRYLLVSEKLKEIIIKSNYKGLKLTPSNELQWPKGVLKP